MGSGKSTVARIFREWGIPVYLADEAGRQMLRRKDVHREVIQSFGEKVLNPGGQIDRRKLAQVVFGSEPELKRLNAIIHPRVRQDFREWVAGQHKAPYVIQEAAILFESGQYADFHKIIVVTAPEELRFKRVAERDGMSRKAFDDRSRHQLDEDSKAARADFVIVNDGRQPLIPQLRLVHRQLLEASGKHKQT